MLTVGDGLEPGENDATAALRHTQAELERVKGLLWQRELLLENTEQGIWHLDNAGLTVFVNPAMCRLLGRERSEIMGRSVFDFFSGPDLGILNDQLERRKYGHKRGYEIGLARPDGSRVECFNNATPIHDEAGGRLGSVGMWTDLTPLKQARREIDAALAESLAQRAEYEALLTSFPGSIGVLDQDARYVFVNPSLAALMGRSVDDIVGRPAHEIVGPERAAVLIADFPRLRAGEIIIDIKDQPPSNGLPGYMLRLHRVAGPAGADGRQLFYAFGIDISDMVKGEAKGNFLTHMSHEIRTPMNAIIGLTALALRTALTPQQQDYLGKVQQAAHSLMGLLDDVLDLSKIESGKLEIEAIAFCLDEVLDGTAAMLGVLAEEKGLSLRVSREPEVPGQLVGDPLRLRQVLNNLISNARKFTPQGGITVTVALASRQDDRVTLRFSVADTGIGMSAAEQARLFQPFSQADESITRRFGGTGLGLSISRQLVELMGGHIHVESEPGKGSTFCFELPFQLSTPLPVAALQAPAGLVADGVSAGLTGLTPDALASIQGARILLVEDNAVNQQVASELLTQAGFRVEVAGDGLQGLARLGEAGSGDQFDCVLMDLQMPMMDGYAAAARIRANPDWAALPVLAMSANVMAGDRERAAQAGMNAHIAKPIMPRDLFAALVKWIPAGERERPVAAAGARPARLEPTPLPTGVPGLVLPQTLIDAANHKPGLVDTLLRQFLQDHANDTQALRQALACGELQAAQRIAHTLKGLGGSIGALTMAQRAATLELALRDDRHDALAGLIDALDEVLAPLMAGLRNWIEAATPAPCPLPLAGAAADPVAVLALCNALELRLKALNPHAAELARALVSALRDASGGVPGSALVTAPENAPDTRSGSEQAAGSRLVTQAQTFEFDAALASLRQLRAGLFGPDASTSAGDEQSRPEDLPEPGSTLSTPGPAPALQADNRPRILMVDDERFNLNMLDSLLRHDYQVMVAIDGQRALQAAATHSPDLILLDIQLPDIDGYEVCRRLKADALTRGIPVIFITALDESANEARGLEVGAVDYITKPFKQAAVSARLRTQLRLKQQHDQLERYAFRDSLTGLTNRRAFDSRAEQEWSRCWRGRLPLSVIMLDVDHFKRYNDTHGHAAGDVCLQRVAQTLEKSIKRAGDLLARYGGEEFIVLLPGAAASGALAIGEALRAAVEEAGIEHKASKVADTVTVSVGVATLSPSGAEGLAALLEAADRMLYAAKVQGRNRVLGFDPKSG